MLLALRLSACDGRGRASRGGQNCTGQLAKLSRSALRDAMGKAKPVDEDAVMEEEKPEKPKKKSSKKDSKEAEDAPKEEKKSKRKEKAADGEDKPAKKAKKAVEADAEAEEPKKKAAKVVKEAPAEEAPQPPADDPNSLDNFDLSPAVRTKLRECGIAALFPIQAATFKIVMDGNDIVGRARTGQARHTASLRRYRALALTCVGRVRAQGKTLAFVLPILESLARDALAAAEKPGGAAASKAQGRAPLVVVLAPTRELAKQARGLTSARAPLAQHNAAAA